MEALVRRGGAALVGVECAALSWYVWAGWEVAGGLGLDGGTGASNAVRLAVVGPWLILLSWLVVTMVALWTGRQPVATLMRWAQRTILCLVAAANLWAAFLTAAVDPEFGVNVALAGATIVGTLAVAVVCALVATGRLRGQPSGG